MAAGTAYAKRYAGGFLDKPTLTTPIDQAFLNAVEAALLQLIGSAPTTDGQVMQWDTANTRYGPALLLNKNIDPAAAIAKSKLDFTGANGIVNADVAGAAAIARSKLDFGAGLVNSDIAAAAAIATSKISGYLPGAVIYRKTTPKVVNTSIASTDLLNGEITIGAGVMGTTGLLRLTAFGDFKNNSGGSLDIPRLTLKLGATTLLDANITGAAVVATGATRYGWKAVFEIMNNGAANSQWATMDAWWTFANPGVFGANFFATGGGITGTVLNSTILSDFVHSHGGNSAAVDTTAAQALTLNVVNNSANANYETELRGALVEVI